MARVKADDVLAARRIDDVLRIRLDGAETWDLRPFVTAKEAEEGSAWFLKEGESPLADRTLRWYWERAGQAIQESCGQGRKILRRNHLAKRRNLYARAVTTGDLSTAAKILKDEAELLGLYPAKKIDMEVIKKTILIRLDGELDGLTDEQLDALAESVIAEDAGTLGPAKDRAKETPEG